MEKPHRTWDSQAWTWFLTLTVVWTALGDLTTCKASHAIQGVTQWWVPWVVCLFWLLYILAWVLEQSATRKWHWALLKAKQPIKPSPTKSLYSPANDHEEGSSARWYPFDYCHPTLGKCHKRTHTFLPPHQVLRGCKTKPCWPCPPGTNKAEVTPLPYPPGPGDCGEEPQPALTE